MKPFNPGDVVKRISHGIGTIHCNGEYIIEIDYSYHDNGDGCVTLVGHTGHYDREYFQLVKSVNDTEDNTEDDLNNCTYLDYTHFKVGDIVIRNTERYEDSFMKKGNAYKITEIINKNVIKVEGSVEGYTSFYFHKIKFKFNVGDIVQSNSIHLKKGFNVRGKIHSMSQNGSYFHFEDNDGNKSLATFRVKDFELVAECKDANSNNDVCFTSKVNLDEFDAQKVSSVHSDDNVFIKVGDTVERTGSTFFEVKRGFKYIVHDINSCGDLQLIIDGKPSNYFYYSKLFIVIPHGIDYAPYVSDSNSVGDSNSSNPIIPMSKTFNDYAVEAFMSNEDNRTNAIDALATLNKLNDDLELVSDQIKKVKSVLISDIRRLQNAMNESYIDVISEMIKENPDVKEYVDRFMDNRLVSLIPESEAVVKSIQDKFK